MAYNPVFRDKKEHNKICNSIRGKVHNIEVSLLYSSIEDQVAEILTQPLHVCKFGRFCDGLCRVNNDLNHSEVVLKWRVNKIWMFHVSLGEVNNDLNHWRGCWNGKNIKLVVIMAATVEKGKTVFFSAGVE